VENSLSKRLQAYLKTDYVNKVHIHLLGLHILKSISDENHDNKNKKKLVNCPLAYESTSKTNFESLRLPGIGRSN
jgi:hypothetical protein